MTNSAAPNRPPAPFHCRVLHHHHWVTRSAEDGSRYEACRDCGKERPDQAWGGAAPIAG